jgi:hypothetical protein
LGDFALEERLAGAVSELNENAAGEFDPGDGFFVADHAIRMAQDGRAYARAVFGDGPGAISL